MICPLTGSAHRLFWMRSAWWCHDCRQKVESCCEGSCPSIADTGFGPNAGTPYPTVQVSPATSSSASSSSEAG